MRNPTPNSLSVLSLQVFIAITLLILWEYFGNTFPKIAFALGTPTQIGSEFWLMLIHQNLLWHFFITASEALLGLLLGSIIGFGLGLSLWFSRSAAQVSRPFVVFISSLPIIAIAPLMIVWFGIGFEMKVVVAGLSTLFVAFNHAYRGIGVVGQKYIDVMAGMRASKSATFFKVVIPGSMEWLLSSMRLNIGFALLGAFIGEFIASNEGLGYLILRASSRCRSRNLYACNFFGHDRLVD